MIGCHTLFFCIYGANFFLEDTIDLTTFEKKNNLNQIFILLWKAIK